MPTKRSKAVEPSSVTVLPAVTDAGSRPPGGPMAAPDNKPLQASASKVAADAIREMILNGELSQGDRLPPERVLAQTFGFSRSSVREAVRELAALGVLSARQGDGTYVSTLKSHDLFAPLDFALRVDSNSLLHLTELRLLLEPHVTAMAAARLTPAAAEQLERALDAYEREVEAGGRDAAALIAADEEIHGVIADLGGNPLIRAILRSVDSAVHRSREITVVQEAAPQESLTELRAVVDGVLANDPARAEAAMTWHVARWAERIRDGVGVDDAPDLPASTA